MIPKKSAKADMGKWAEKKTQEFLAKFSAECFDFDWQRMPDAKAARGALAAQIADFEIFRPQMHGVIEVKEVQHDFRLSRSRVPQLPRIRKRALAGGTGILLVYHSTTGKWRIPNFNVILEEKSPSWDLREFREYDTAEAALLSHYFFYDKRAN